MDNLEAIELEAIQSLQIEMKTLYSVWMEIGLKPEQQQKRIKVAWNHIHALIKEIKQEEIDLSVELKEKIKSYSEKVCKLANELSLKPSQVTDLTYLDRLEALEKEYELFNETKELRLSELNSLRVIERKYCELFDMKEHTISSTTEVPSEADLEELQQHVNMLSEEHSKRYKKYCQAREQLTTILEVTEVIPETTLEKYICSNKEPLSLSKSTFQEIEEIIEKAKQKKEEMENKKKALIEKLNLLWERLNVEESLRVEFMSNHSDCKASTLSTIQLEINKYEEMKKQNLKVFVDAIRKELNELWSACGATDLEKQLSDPHIEEDVTESILNALEMEAERWKEYYEQVKFILDKIAKREKMWDQLKALDSKANDPTRFKNRGGNLLREEKERNKVLRMLPTLDKDIYEVIGTYELETYKKFLYRGEDYRLTIFNQWEERKGCKENIKEKNLLTPAKQNKLGTPKSCPRPRLAIYRTPSGKRRTPKSASKLMPKREPEILKDTAAIQNTTSSNATSYPDFEMELNSSKRKSFRSSVVASKKIGGTRSPLPSKKRKSLATIPASPDLACVRGKAGMPFLM